VPTGSHRRQQCTYRERNTRCRRDGTGSPPLCAPHKLQAAEDARRAEAEENRSSIGSLFEDFLYGRPINREKVVSAVNEFAWGIGGGYGALHEIFEEDDPYHEDTGEFEHQRRNRNRPPNQREYNAPPPVDNEFLQQKLAIQRAKVALGFAESEPVTLQQVKQRQRELARKFHPDMPGGSLAKMQAINAAVDLLERVNRPVL